MAINTRGLVLGATVVTVATVTLTGAGIHVQGQPFFKDSPKELVDEVWQIIDKTYVDATFNQVNWRSVRQEYLNRTYSDRQEAYEAIREMLNKLNDPYTRFMDPEEFKNMQIDTSGELTGVGIQITQDEETKDLVVVSPIEDTPAFDAGIQSQDVIVEINGQSTEGMDLNDAVEKIRGPIGSEVTLTIRRDGKEMDFTITRARIEIHPVRHEMRQVSEKKIGYIRLVQFSSNAAEEMRTAINELEEKDVEGYILDLRSNPGGLLFSSVEIARMWLEDGTIVSTVNRRGKVDRQKANGKSLTQEPLVLLVDKGSASASEILAGALQDNERATLVGSQTFGKGLVQSVQQVGDNAGLAVTIAKYLTPDGRDINKEGIKPDVELELTEQQREKLRDNRKRIGTKADPQYVKGREILLEKIN